MSATPWAIGSTEYAQERASVFWRWRDSGVAPQANRRSQANLERLEALREAESRDEGRWERVRLESVRPDGCRVTVCGYYSRQELAALRKDHRWHQAKHYGVLRSLVAETPVAPPEPMTREQVEGQNALHRYAMALAGWQRRYLCMVPGCAG